MRRSLVPLFTVLFIASIGFAAQPLLVLKGEDYKGQRHWWVESVLYPYQPSSYVPAAKPVDDGHGHAPGAH